MSARIIKLAIMAVGGQGGGVLTNWVESMARSQGYAVQATSVAGVAQRTGATIYYVEMAAPERQTPVFSLAPAAGDVDILIAAELMEAGRAVMRGFVTPDRTTLIASSHRALAVSEKMTPGDGIADSEEVRAGVEIAAQKLILLDMERIAIDAGSVISASLFGALAASRSLPFPREAFVRAIQTSGKSAEASLRAFEHGFAAVENNPQHHPIKSAEPTAQGSKKLVSAWQEILNGIDEFPPQVQKMTRAGLNKVVDFQDLEYGMEYLERLRNVMAHDLHAKEFHLTNMAAKHIANAMAYDDLIRVADLKTRQSRGSRIAQEMQFTQENTMHVTEYFHPGAAEIAGLLPRNMGHRIENNQKSMARLQWLFGKSRRIRSDTVLGFLQLYILGGLRWWRVHTWRHTVEQAHLTAWLDRALTYAPENYDLAVETLCARRLIKGYSDTHARGQSKFDKVLAGISTISTRKDAAPWARRLIEAALQDEAGEALDGALETIQSFQ